MPSKETFKLCSACGCLAECSGPCRTSERKRERDATGSGQFRREAEWPETPGRPRASAPSAARGSFANRPSTKSAVKISKRNPESLLRRPAHWSGNHRKRPYFEPRACMRMHTEAVGCRPSSPTPHVHREIASCASCGALGTPPALKFNSAALLVNIHRCTKARLAECSSQNTAAVHLMLLFSLSKQSRQIPRQEMKSSTPQSRSAPPRDLTTVRTTPCRVV